MQASSSPWVPSRRTHEEFCDDLAAWAETEIRLRIGNLERQARSHDDRRHPPAEPEEPAAWDCGATVAPQDPHNGTTESGSAEAQGVDPSTAALLSVSEVISTQGRYLVAARKVDAAWDLLAGNLQRRHDALASSIMVADLRQAAAVLVRLEASRRRQDAVRRCVVGDVQVPRFVCTGCGETKLGAPMSCGHRCCPNCVAKIRRVNQSKAHKLLELVDERRQKDGHLPARWRFLTLTIPSWREFLPMRRLLCDAWARLHRAKAPTGEDLTPTRVWTPTAAIAAMETTHTVRGWHVHLHAVSDAYLERAPLFRAWQRSVLGALLWDVRRDRWRQWTAGIEWSGDADLLARRLLRAADRTGTWDAQRQRIVELHSLVRRAAGSLRWSRERRVRARWALRKLLRLVPLCVAQDVREFTREAGEGDADYRRRMTGELAKYMGKDLGAAGVPDEEADNEWGVAGTTERLAEFIEGTWRWRTLRAYGYAYGADLRAAERCGCLECGGDVEVERVEWMSPGEYDRRKKKEARARVPQEERLRRDARPARVLRQVQFAVPDDLPDGRLRELLGWMNGANLAEVWTAGVDRPTLTSSGATGTGGAGPRGVGHGTARPLSHGPP